MNVTGYQLKEALKIKAILISSLYGEHEDSMFAFKEEQKRKPEEILEEIKKHEREVAVIQTVQSEFNLSTEIEVQDLGKMSLEQGIKMVGGYGRMSKMYRTFAKGTKRDRWDRHREMVRNNNEEVATPTLTRSQALDEAKKLEKIASGLRSAIAMANSKSFSTIILTEEML